MCAFFAKSFIVSALTYRSLVTFYGTFTEYEVENQVFFVFVVISQVEILLSRYLLLKTLFFSSQTKWSFVPWLKIS